MKIDWKFAEFEAVTGKHLTNACSKMFVSNFCFHMIDRSRLEVIRGGEDDFA
jgi:hypothetical protein